MIAAADSRNAGDMAKIKHKARSKECPTPGYILADAETKQDMPTVGGWGFFLGVFVRWRLAYLFGPGRNAKDMQK